MTKPDLKGLKSEQLQYVTSLETELLTFKNDGAKRLLFQLSGIAGDFADDISNIRSGLQGTYINDDKDDKMIDKVMKLVDKMDKFKLLAQLTADVTEEEVTKPKKIVKRPEDLIRGI